MRCRIVSVSRAPCRWGGQVSLQILLFLGLWSLTRALPQLLMSPQARLSEMVSALSPCVTRSSFCIIRKAPSESCLLSGSRSRSGSCLAFDVIACSVPQGGEGGEQLDDERARYTEDGSFIPLAHKSRLLLRTVAIMSVTFSGWRRLYARSDGTML